MSFISALKEKPIKYKWVTNRPCACGGETFSLFMNEECCACNKCGAMYSLIYVTDPIMRREANAADKG